MYAVAFLFAFVLACWLTTGQYLDWYFPGFFSSLDTHEEHYARAWFAGLGAFWFCLGFSLALLVVLLGRNVKEDEVH